MEDTTKRRALGAFVVLALALGFGFWQASTANESDVPEDSDTSPGGARDAAGDQAARAEDRVEQPGPGSQVRDARSLRVTDATSGAGLSTAEAFVWPSELMVTNASSLRAISPKHLAGSDGAITITQPLDGSTQLTVHAPGYFAKSTTYRDANGKVALKPAHALYVWFANLPEDIAAAHSFSVRLHYKEMEWPRRDPIRWTYGWFRRTKFARLVGVPAGGKAVLQHVVEVPGYVEVFMDNRQLVAEEPVAPSQERLVIDFAPIVRKLRAGFDSSLSLTVRLPPEGITKLSAHLHDERGRVPPSGVTKWDGQAQPDGVTLTFRDLAPGRYTPRIQYETRRSRTLASIYLKPVEIDGHTEAVRTIPAAARLEVSLARYQDPVNPVFRIERADGKIVTTVSMSLFPAYRAPIDMLTPGVYRAFAWDPGDQRRPLRSRAAWITVNRPGQDLGLVHFELRTECKVKLVVGTVTEVAETLAIYHGSDDALEQQLELGEAFEHDVKLPEGRYRLVATYPSGRKVEKIADLSKQTQRFSLE